MAVRRFKTSGEQWFSFLKTLYMSIAFPLAIILGVPAIFWASSLLQSGAYTVLTFCILLWLGILIPVVLWARRTRARLKLINNISEKIRSSSHFLPVEGNEYTHPAAGKYLGIDPVNGSVLYINQIRKGQVDVIGLTMESWTVREIEGETLRIYTKLLDLPCIEIRSPWAKRWYDLLGVMEHKRYSTPKPFPEYVRDHVAQLERDNRIHIPQVV